MMRNALCVLALLVAAPACLPRHRPEPPAKPTATPLALEQASQSFALGLSSQWQSSPHNLPGATFYEIELTLEDGLLAYSGRETVHYQNNEASPLADVAFILFPKILGGEMTVTETSVNGKPAPATLDESLALLTVQLAEQLAPRERVVVELGFVGRIADTVSRNYGVQAYSDGVLALAHFYPMVPVYDERGWDVDAPSPSGDLTFTDASFFVVSVDAPPDLTLVTSGVEVSRESGNARQRVTFAAGPARDFYLAGSRVFQERLLEAGPTTVRMFARADHSGAAEAVLSYAAHALRFLGGRLGPYPYTELDLVGTPTLALGVEYPGVVALADRILDPSDPRLEATVVHEIAHQWFYNLVGNDQLDEPWLDEALAQYATLLYFEETYGKDGGTGFRQSLEGRWGSIGRAPIPVGQPVSMYSGQEYGAIVYGRGPLFFDEVRAQVGDDAFERFMRDYVSEFAWGIATTEGLKAEAERSTGYDLTPLFDSWIY